MRSLATRLAAHSVEDGEHVAWEGPRRLRVSGAQASPRFWSWELHRGRVPPGMRVVVTCDRDGCIRPEHLRLVPRSPLIAAHLAQQRCPNGHRYTRSNTYRDRDGGRHCRSCHRERERARYTPKPAEQRTCEECGREFETKLAARYCSSSCNSRAWRKARKAAAA